MKQGDRVMIRADAFGDAPRLMKHRGQTGKVTKYWQADNSTVGLVLLRLDNGESLYVFGNEVAPLQVTVGG